MKASTEQLGGGWARMWTVGVGDIIRRRQAWLAAKRDENGRGPPLTVCARFLGHSRLRFVGALSLA